MKLGEIKLEALRLMFVNQNDELTIEKLNKYEQDETYRSYLINMTGSLNRCFSSLEEKRVLPSKSYKIEQLADLQTVGAFLRFDLSSIKDFYDIERVVRETADGDYDGDFDFRREGNVLILDGYEKSEGVSYTVVYKPRLERITSLSSKDTELTMPDNIAAYIPYFIKGDLYRDDEPNEASEARNWYEAAMEELMVSSQNKISKSTQIKTIYSQV